MHRETSWWMIRQFTGIQLETVHMEGDERMGCHGIGLGAGVTSARCTVEDTEDGLG